MKMGKIWDGHNHHLFDSYKKWLLSIHLFEKMHISIVKLKELNKIETNMLN